MDGNYTRSALTFGVEDPEVDLIWKKMRTLLDEKVIDDWRDWEELWKSQLEKIASDFTMSCRYALLRKLYQKSKKNETKDGIEIVIRKDVSYILPKLTKEYVERLTEEELQQYKEILMDIASTQADASKDPEAYEYLITKALKDEAGMNRIVQIGGVKVEGQQSSLSRDEALKLGHMLGYSLKDMQWFLLRVFDFEDSLRYFSSNDLIEVFGFCAELSWQEVEKLKAYYKEQESKINIEKENKERPDDWTKTMVIAFPKIVERWTRTGKECAKDAFKKWLIEHAPLLDRPSRTALRIYRCLAVYIYQICNGTIKVPEKVLGLRKHIREICGKDSRYNKVVEELIYSEEKGANFDGCKQVASTIRSKFQLYYTEEKTAVTAWRGISVDEEGKPCEKRREKEIDKILRGEINPEKQDILLLVWFCFNLLWEKEVLTVVFKEKIKTNIDLFYTTSAEVLKTSLSTEFYPPHIQEQSMLLSIVAASYADEEAPAVHYVNIWEALIERRNRNEDDDTQLRILWEKGDRNIEGSVENSIKKTYKNILIGDYNIDGNYDGLLSILSDFMLDDKNHMSKDCRFTFHKTGIEYSNKDGVSHTELIEYPNDKIAYLFDLERKDYEEDQAYQERFSYLCGLTYMIEDVMKKNKPEAYTCSFRKNIKRPTRLNTTLMLTKWEKKETKRKR